MELEKIQNKNVIVMIDISRINYDPFEVLVSHIVLKKKSPKQKIHIIHQEQLRVNSLIDVERKIKELINNYNTKTIVDGLDGKITTYNT